VALTAETASVAAALHADAGFAEVWTAETFATLLAMPGAGGLVALEADAPVGLILWRVAADEGEILTIGVLRGHRHRGTGRALLDAATEAMRHAGATRLFLEVAVDNAAAIALYRRAGFVERGRRPGYYAGPRGPTDALILSIDL
jgi:ribosomal-protein-alanine N-acetyltransferase